ncbi:synemin [Echeneis naucrates]|uniref:IF rod domain-containing protein n=1 Tax=Echeneis naucrates TaxID=173247 RepID=A0A665TKC5_ECHNA|nr:synemin [Echeneis naucrates]
MLPFKRTFESEKQQLQQLNSRLGQYLSRTKQLEQENAHLIAEINKLRLTKTAELEPSYKAEMRELRRMVGQLSLEKSQAEMEREKLWRELQMVRSVCSEQTEVCRDISGELKDCESELHCALKTNGELQQRLLRLETEYQSLEDAQRQEKDQLRRHVEARVVPIITQTYRGPAVASTEEVQEYARGVSEGWIQTFEMYQQKVEEMEQSIKADQAMLAELQREKMLYASELDKLRREAEKQGQVQMRLEEELMHMQEKFHVDFSEYQMIIEQLERERNIMADTIAEKMKEHQHLLQVKMDLGMEVAAYRALLEGQNVGIPDAHRRVNQHQRERIIDIKMPAQPYTPRASILHTRQHMDIRYTPPVSSLRRSTVPPSGSISPSRVIPISVAGRDRYQSPASRRDMISFAKARATAATPATTTTTTTDAAKDKHTPPTEKPGGQVVQKTTTTEEKTVKIKTVSQVENTSSPVKSSTAETKSVRMVSPPMMTLSTKTEAAGKKQLSGDAEIDYGKFRDKEKIEPGAKKILDSVSVEDIVERAMKPAGLEASVCSSGDSKVRYHVEKTQQEDGTTKTQIVLESKVEEELDVSEDSTLEELLGQGVKKVSLEDIKDTATGGMIKNLLSELQGAETLQNKSVNVEIIEEPIDSYSDEDLEVEQKSRSIFYEPSSTYFQIEELENVPLNVHVQSGDEHAMKSPMTDTDHTRGRSVHVEEVSRQSESPYFSHEQEPHEYYVSTPDDNLSEAEEGSGITSYGHYGLVDDLSDERYYQDESFPLKRTIVEESDEYKFLPGVKESFPECIIEEEVRVSPVVQESVLEFLREDSLDPKEQLKGALEKLQSSVSGPLREELSFLTKVSSEIPQNVAVDVKKVQQSNDNGTMTIVAELNVSQTLEDSGLLEPEDDLSEEQIVAALRSSNLELEKTFQGAAGGEYSFRVTKGEDVGHGEEFEGSNIRESVSEITEKYIKLSPSEKSFTFQMDVQSSHSDASAGQGLQPQIPETPVKIPQEKRVATIYLESPTDD